MWGRCAGALLLAQVVESTIISIPLERKAPLNCDQVYYSGDDRFQKFQCGECSCGSGKMIFGVWKILYPKLQQMDILFILSSIALGYPPAS